MSQSQRVFITGAGSGLGRALALHYARQGARVACTDRDLASVDATLAQVVQAGGSLQRAAVSPSTRKNQSG